MIVTVTRKDDRRNSFLEVGHVGSLRGKVVDRGKLESVLSARSRERHNRAQLVTTDQTVSPHGGPSEVGGPILLNSIPHMDCMRDSRPSRFNTPWTQLITPCWRTNGLVDANHTLTVDITV